MYRITYTDSHGAAPVIVEVDTKAQAEDVANAIGAVLVTRGATGGVVARWYDQTHYFGSKDSVATVKAERVKAGK